MKFKLNFKCVCSFVIMKNETFSLFFMYKKRMKTLIIFNYDFFSY